MRGLLLALLALPAAAQDLPAPAGGERTLATVEAPASHRVATGPFGDGGVPTATAEGRVVRRVWRVPDAPGTSLGLLAPLRAALREAGWEVVFECEAAVCGGFDFRFALDVAPVPDMFVSLGDYRYLSATRPSSGDGSWLDLLVSRSGGVGYVQATSVTPPDAPAPVAAAPVPVRAASNVAPTALSAALDATGRAVLDDLAFPSGATALEGGPYASLAALADYLDARPDITVALVGHTDAQGGTDGNLRVSQARAEAARAALIERHGIDPARVEARGVAYFAPRAANDTPEGRAANRRVEAVVTSAE